MHFIIEEPMHEEHHHTFHGREIGYVYRDHADSHHDTHKDLYMSAPSHGVHGETLVAPVFNHRPSYEPHQHGDHESRDAYVTYHEIPEHHEREIEYIVDHTGNVHTYEERPQYDHTFLQ